MTSFAHFTRDSSLRVAVIGAGISGLIAARRLRKYDCEVILFEKSRGVGGRMATRRSDLSLSFDHGAQYFTVRDPDFSRSVKAWADQAVVTEWTGRIVQIDGGKVRLKTQQPRRYVGMPGMTGIARQVAADLTLRCNTQITKVRRTISGWELTDSAGETHRQFDYVIVSLPAPQSAELLGDHPLAIEANEFPMTPCWAILAGFEGRIEVDWDGAFVQGSPLAWVARNSSKPGREPSKECWVFHASADWSAAHFELDREDAAATLLCEFSRLVSVTLPQTNHLDAHRWRYSSTPRTVDRLALFDGETGLAVCGDWLAGGRVEGAFRSGLAAAAHIIRAIGAVSEERIFGAM